ncbi:MAG TPA: GNAT family N-acetyltransferase [Pseudonocardiaceae bacterium]|nr:GNAT family N-acetyltransferase [Pseudonocardiaceae bacterium]
MVIKAVPLDHPDAALLIDEVQQVYVGLYGGHDSARTAPDEFAPPHGVFLVGYAAGEPVACGGWREHPETAPADAELKRMYVTPRARGCGYARAILAELERTASAAGRTRMVLETGTKQPEAMTLYESAGYRPMPNFSIHAHSPTSRCLGKELD